MHTVLRAVWRRFAAVITECNRAQRRIAQLRADPGRYLPHPGSAPDTCEEFLLRTSGPLTHEPSAAQRSLGKVIR
jgi:hypothetical protein